MYHLQKEKNNLLLKCLTKPYLALKDNPNLGISTCHATPRHFLTNPVSLPAQAAKTTCAERRAKLTHICILGTMDYGTERNCR